MKYLKIDYFIFEIQKYLIINIYSNKKKKLKVKKNSNIIIVHKQ